jgi:hypothetical protein
MELKMKTPPTEPGLYFHLSVHSHDSVPSKSKAYICKMNENGFFWHPVHLRAEDCRGSFIRIPEELHEVAWKEAKEVFVEEKAKWILCITRNEWDRKRHLEKVDDEFRELVEAKMKELDANCL